jgi:hypothetical protein
VIGAANNAGDFINMIEDGQFSAELNRDLAELAATMHDHASATNKKAKGKVTIVIDLETEVISSGTMFKAVASHKVKAPEMKRRATVLFTDEFNRFTRTPPRQGQIFGVREVNVEATNVRTI